MKIDVETDRDGTRFVTREPVLFMIRHKLMEIEPGFESDGMSVPRFLWRVIDPAITGETLVPAIIHDYLYTIKITSRGEADAYFRDALLENNYPEFKAWLIWAGLRMFGWTHWR